MTTNSYTYENIFLHKNSVLFVVAHPDDLDGIFGGLLARLSEDKKECYFLILTSGEAGIGDQNISSLREKEQLSSLSILGVNPENVEFGHLKDSLLKDDFETIGLISKTIRFRKPEIVCTIDPKSTILETKYPHINHRDHRVTGQTTLDAVYPYSSLKTFYPEYGEPFKPYEILLAESSTPNFILNTTKQIETKRKLISMQNSQWDQKIINEILDEDLGDDGNYYEKYFYAKLGW